jgi:hypothetical protein
MFALRNDNETTVVQRERIRGILATLNPIRCKKRMEFVNRDLNAAMNSRQCAILKKIPEERTQLNFLGQPLRL